MYSELATEINDNTLGPANTMDAINNTNISLVIFSFHRQTHITIT